MLLPQFGGWEAFVHMHGTGRVLLAGDVVKLVEQIHSPGSRISSEAGAPTAAMRRAGPKDVASLCQLLGESSSC